MLPVYVLTNDNHLWLLRGFCHLWAKFYSADAPVTVCGYNPPPFALPANFTFRSLGPTNRPVEQWSDGLIQLCHECAYTHFVLMLEDYWLTARTDPRLVHAAWFTLHTSGWLSIDLSGTRQAGKRARVVGQFAGGEYVETPPGTPYQMSFQAAIWNKARLLEILHPGETPWQVEVDGSQRVDAAGLRVLGTRPALLHYKPVYRCKRGALNLDGVPDVGKIEAMGWTSRGVK